MSTEVIEKVEVKKETEALFSKKRKSLVSNPMDSDNPITIQVLGICSALAVTIALQGTLIMAFAVMFVVMMANVVISALRNTIPNRIRIIVQLVVVATLVATVDQTLRAFAYEQSKALSVFVGLIITNCIVMGRLEAFAMGNKPWDSLLDGFGNSLGYAWIIIAIAFVRELLGRY
jgi:Na+-transporting NADH:ubiquinone oxidoreductase subunit D